MATGAVIMWLVSKTFFPLSALLLFVIFLASIGKSFGMRRLFVKILLLVFEWGRQKIIQHETEKKEEQAGTGDELINGDARHVIEREVSLSSRGMFCRNDSLQTPGALAHEFQLKDAMYFCKSGIESIIQDGVTERFSAEELVSWNLLTRTNMHYQFISTRLTVLWILGFILRYIILLPFRFFLAVFAIMSLIVGTALVGYMPEGKFKQWLNYRVSVTCFRIMARAFSAVVTYHNQQNKAKSGGICVANHTSPIDIIILGCDNCYASVGQAQGGFMGIMQRAMLRATAHIWFQRSEARDRNAVLQRLKDHVTDTEKLPILIFPEGTCINNTSIMMFKKGSFEVGGVIYPVAIKYDPRFADAFWNSSAESLLKHLLLILTSWAIVCDVWYLPPERQRPDENAIQFANRVKQDIARQGGLVDLDWDGQLKRSKPKPSMKELQQKEFSRRIKAD